MIWVSAERTRFGHILEIFIKSWRMLAKITSRIPEGSVINLFLLLDTALSQTAKVIYAVLLDRATLSQANGWVDHGGRLYLIFPIAGIAGTVGKSISTVKDALNELERAELIERKRRGLSMPNRIYMKLPSGQKSGFQQAGKLPIQEPENAPLEGGETGFQTAGKAATISL